MLTKLILISFNELIIMHGIIINDKNAALRVNENKFTEIKRRIRKIWTKNAKYTEKVIFLSFFLIIKLKVNKN